MLKTALLLLNVTGYLLFNILFADGVVIEDNTPTYLAPGEKAKVEIHINKGNVTGFAKLQLELPDGMSATPVDTKGASFTFSGQKAKFIWMSLPQDQEFTVSYFLEAAPSAIGNKVIKGTFSYIKENQRVDYEMQSKVVTISTDATVANNINNTNSNSDSQESISGLRCERTITALNNAEYMVNLRIKESDLDGFAKIQEIVPNGFIIQEEDSDGAVVTTSEDGVKFVWFEVPQMSEFGVSYRLIAETEGITPDLTGTFSYVLDNQPKEVAVIDLSSPEMVADNTNTSATENTEEYSNQGTNTENDTAENTATDLGDNTDNKADSTAPDLGDNADNTADNTANNTAQQETENKEESATNVVVDKDESTDIAQKEAPKSTSVPNPETGVSYKVQIAASHNVVSQSYFEKKHNFKKRVNIEHHEGWVKYTTGSFDIYKGARDERERIRNAYTFKGPFVTAYNDGERITVQEALMISKQKWYK